MTLRNAVSHRLRPALLAVALGLAAAPAAAQERQPIEGAGDWTLADTLPGVEGRACTARIPGTEVNIILGLNNPGLPLLIASRPEWSHGAPRMSITLSVDGGAPVTIEGSAVMNLVLMVIDNADLLQRLRAGRTLDLTLPFGRFHANIAGFGPALEAVQACQNGAPAVTH